MRNAIAVFITCNAIHATAISLPLLSGELRSPSPKSGICKPNLPQHGLGWVDLG